jgi:hypothetical protein
VLFVIAVGQGLGNTILDNGEDAFERTHAPNEVSPVRAISGLLRRLWVVLIGCAANQVSLISDGGNVLDASTRLRFFLFVTVAVLDWTTLDSTILVKAST